MLLSLPNEIIHSICCLFCAHCCDSDRLPLGLRYVDDSNILRHHHEQDIRALQCLLQTCTKLRTIAQPVLYHAPIFYSYTRLARTLLARPDLAMTVRAYIYLLRVREYGPKYPSFAVYEDIAFMLETASALGVVKEGISANNLFFPSASMRESSQPILPIEGLITRPRYADYIHVQMEWFDKLAEQTILALLINVEIVVVRVTNPPHTNLNIPDNHFARIFLNPRQTWPLIHTLAIEYISPTADKTALSILYDHQALLNGSLNLQKLVLSNIGKTKLPLHIPQLLISSLNKIRQLVLHGVVVRSAGFQSSLPQTSYIAELIALCPNLESISMRLRNYAIDAWEGPSDFSPTLQLQDLPIRTLQHLALYSSYTELRQDVIHEGLGSLKNFTALTSLIIDEQCFCKHWLQDKDPPYHYKASYIPDFHQACLTSILPPNIVDLTLRLHDKYYAIKDIIELGRQVANGSFPTLSTVSIIVVDEVKRKHRYKYIDDAILRDKKWHKFLEEVVKTQNELERKTRQWRQQILAAFVATEVNIVVERVVEDLFSREPQRAISDTFYVQL